jgi:hypothetical protein
VDQLALLHSLRKFAAETATKANPEKWEQAKRDAVASMGGKHSARAMQQAVRLYKERGGEYKGKKPPSSENSLKKWTKQEWQTRPGTPEKAERKDGSTSRYLPKEKWKSLSKSEQVATDKKKLKSDEQYVSNTRAAKVKSDADYYDKKAGLHMKHERLRIALYNHGQLKMAMDKEAFSVMQGLGMAAQSPLLQRFGIKGIGAARRGASVTADAARRGASVTADAARKGGRLAKDVYTGAVIKAPEFAANYSNPAVYNALGGTEVSALGTVAGKAGLSSLEEALRARGLKGPSDVAHKLFKLLKYKSSDLATVGLPVGEELASTLF